MNRPSNDELDRLLRLARPEVQPLAPVEADRMFRSVLARSGALTGWRWSWLVPAWAFAAAALVFAAGSLSAHLLPLPSSGGPVLIATESALPALDSMPPGDDTHTIPSATAPEALPVTQVTQAPPPYRSGRHHRHRVTLVPEPGIESRPGASATVRLAGIPFLQDTSSVDSSPEQPFDADSVVLEQMPASAGPDPSSELQGVAGAALFVAVTDVPEPAIPVTVREEADDVPGTARASSAVAERDGRWLLTEVEVSSTTSTSGTSGTPSLVLRSIPPVRQGP